MKACTDAGARRAESEPNLGACGRLGHGSQNLGLGDEAVGRSFQGVRNEAEEMPRVEGNAGRVLQCDSE